MTAYERKYANPKSVLDNVHSLRGEEPWPGYDELTVEEVQQALPGADEQRVRARDVFAKGGLAARHGPGFRAGR